MGAGLPVAQTTTRARRLTIIALLIAALTGVFSAGAAFATAPIPLDDGFVTDDTAALSSSEHEAVETRLDELASQSDADLFVVFVDRFTDPADRIEWTDQVAVLNNLGANQYLPAIAVDERSYYISADLNGPLSDAKLTDVQQKIQPLLSDGDWAGAVILAADEIQGDGGAGVLRFVLAAAAVIVLALIIWAIVRAVRAHRRREAVRRRGAMPETPDPNDPFSTMTDEQVATAAGSALVQADDAITSSREELGFAVAQYGEAATAEFTQAVDAAKAKMSEAFDLKQKLDDEVEDSVFDRRAWNLRIVALCDEIDDTLDAQTAAFDALRRLEQNAGPELERVRGERAAAQPAVDEADAAVSRLTGEYDPTALASVADNPSQARERLALADRSLAAAAEALAAGRTGEAAFAIRTAEQSTAQAVQLVQAITALGDELQMLEGKARELIAELQTDVVTAARLPDSAGAIAPVIAATTAQLQQAQSELTGASRSPQRVLDALTTADAQIDAAIAQGTETVQREQRARQLLDQTLAQAQSEIRATREFIDTRRGTVGDTARTRLSQAEAAIAHATSVRDRDSVVALREAQNALALSQQAFAAAQSDLTAYSPGGWGGSPYGGSGGSDLAGDILGGIIGGLLAGGGSGGGGFSGGSSGNWRSSGGGGFRTSGFGGSGRSSRSSSFGRSGGGRSGRSGGGRF